jgi:hypothetical protein
MRMTPRRRIDGKPKRGSWTSHREIHHGTRPAPIPAAITKKSADPNIANAFLAEGLEGVTFAHGRASDHARFLLRPEPFQGSMP